MRSDYVKYIPLAIGVVVGIGLFRAIGWWCFLVLFPWIGASISIGIFLRQALPKGKKELGRRGVVRIPPIPIRRRIGLAVNRQIL